MARSALFGKKLVPDSIAVVAGCNIVMFLKMPSEKLRIAIADLFSNIGYGKVTGFEKLFGNG